MNPRALALLVALSGCGGSDEASEAAPTAHEVVAAAFGPSFFDPTQRARWLTPEAVAALRLPARLDESRYGFLHVGELRRVNPHRRVGEVAFAIDGWPAALDLELSRSDAGWRVSGVGDPREQAALLDLLGPDGLASAPSALPWSGGLAGSDRAGRPSAAVMLLSLRGRTWIDGRPLPEPSRDAVVSALRAALEARAQLARDAHATYRPQVALALPRDASALEHTLLAQWATNAGAEALGLVVRGKDQGPGYLPLARRGPAPPGVSEPDVVRLRLGLEGLDMRVARAERAVPFTTVIDKVGIGQALQTLLRAHAPRGGLIEPWPDGDHGGIVALLDACRAAAPDLPIATVAPP